MFKMMRWLIVFLAAILGVHGLNGPCVRSAQAYEIKRSINYKMLEDGSKLLTDVYLPDNSSDISTANQTEGASEPYPTILMVHGGAWFSGNKAHVSYHAQHAANQGYAVVAINYRLAPRYKFPAQLEDCLDALVWIQDHADEYGFDPDRVAIYGYSAGAHLACLVGMTRNSPAAKQPKTTATPTDASPPSVPKVRAIIAGGAPCEFSWIPKDAKTLAYWLGDSRAAVPEIYRAATPLNFVDEGDPPTLLFHGQSDRVVPLQSPRKMANQLKISQVPYQLHIIKDATHIGAFLDAQARETAILFLDRHLK